ncbi:transposase [Xenophilus sp. Marseille-Q4582]|uniref:transposase n=1 Tax=Xenophilus sp. Marseille-Q4582 TaxID=2866600 RepID=UPI001CE429A4|nr:transposase [Xenophilus sp. Marseille-Q4582]
MARLPRLRLAGMPHHVILRGNNRQPIFAGAADHERLLALLAGHAAAEQVAVHAYVLMPDHFHLLLTPATVDGLPRLMQALGRRYVRYFNDAQGRTGTLWEGRYRATVVQPDPWLLHCMAYLDLNPVHAGLVGRPEDYPWSSHGHYIGQQAQRFITPPPAVWTLGNTPFAREAAYADRVRAGLTLAQQMAIVDATLAGWALGEPAFVAELQGATPRRLTKARAGRPPRAPRPALPSAS